MKRLNARGLAARVKASAVAVDANTFFGVGNQINVPTLEGKGSFTVPEGTQTGAVFRLRGKGIKGVRSRAAGDLFCHTVIETPVKLSDKQKDLLNQFAALVKVDNAKHSPQEKSWLDKVKDFFT